MERNVLYKKPGRYWTRTDASCPIFWLIDCFRKKTISLKGTGCTHKNRKKSDFYVPGTSSLRRQPSTVKAISLQIITGIVAFHISLNALNKWLLFKLGKLKKSAEISNLSPLSTSAPNPKAFDVIPERHSHNKQPIYAVPVRSSIIFFLVGSFLAMDQAILEVYVDKLPLTQCQYSTHFWLNYAIVFYEGFCVYSNVQVLMLCPVSVSFSLLQDQWKGYQLLIVLPLQEFWKPLYPLL